MSNSQQQQQEGVVISTTGSNVTVRITCASACASCSAKKYCNSSETSEREVEAEAAKGEEFQVGEQVIVSISTRQGLMATLYVYVLPLLLLLLTLTILSYFKASEELVALGALGSVVIYFMVLYTLRPHFKKNYRPGVSRLHSVCYKDRSP